MSFVSFFNTYTGLADYVKTAYGTQSFKQFNNFYVIITYSHDCNDREWGGNWTDETRRLINWVAAL